MIKSNTTKFRALSTRGWKPTENNGWYYGTSDVNEYTLDNKKHQHSNLAFFFKNIQGNYFDKNTLSQFIGLVDRNGIEIYEGDIVSTGECVWDNTGKVALMQVTYINDHQCNGFVGIILNSNELSGLYVPVYSRLDSSHIIIGNIHENHELLEQK